MTSETEPTPVDAKPTIVVIDDELGPRESLRFLLKDEYHVLCADTVDHGLDLLREHAPDTVIMDIRMPGRSGIDGLCEIRKRDPDLAVIMLTGFAAVGTAQEAIRHAASDYIEKPFDTSAMRLTIRRHVEQTRLRRKRAKLLSEAEALEQRLRECQGKDRLAELGQVSAEFAHDLRNALTVASGSSGLLRLGMEEVQQGQAEALAEASRYLDILEESMQQCVEMLDTWQGLIRHAPHSCTKFSLHELIRTCTGTCQAAAELAHAHLVCEHLGGGSMLQGDRVQLVRALTNLIHNALHALPPDNGRVCIRSETLETSVRVRVSDNGCGISPENMKRLFTPNFTTRRACGGTGLGLFIAHKIVQSHGGTLTAESVLNQGTTFTLVLPKDAAFIGTGT